MYRMAVVEMKEIKKQVQGLLDQRVIKPSSSPCGSLIMGAKERWHMANVC
jgi:hypothetical protein